MKFVQLWPYKTKPETWTWHIRTDFESKLFEQIVALIGPKLLYFFFRNRNRSRYFYEKDLFWFYTESYPLQITIHIIIEYYFFHIIIGFLQQTIELVHNSSEFEMRRFHWFQQVLNEFRTCSMTCWNKTYMSKWSTKYIIYRNKCTFHVMVNLN